MTTIPIGNQEVSLEAAKRVHAHYSGPRSFYNALSAAIKEAEEVDGPFGRIAGFLTFRGNNVGGTCDGGVLLVSDVAADSLNRILSQHFVSKDELQVQIDAALESMENPHATAIEARNWLHGIRALIEKGQNDE